MPERPGGRLFLVTGQTGDDTGDDAHGGDTHGDAALVAACLRQEEWAAAALWDRFAPLVRRILFRAVGPGHDVEDLVQECFLRLYRTLPGLRDPDACKSFVITITTRVLQTELRSRWLKRWLGLSADGEIPERAGESADLEARGALARFYRLLDGLAPRHRTAFTLRYIEGLELTEVAAALGVSLATIKRWLPRIARRLHAQAARDPQLQPYVSPKGFQVGGS
jgi:RNA polymerase sigma-70 factor, ECF subfamily